MINVKSVKHLEGYRLSLTFTDGTRGVVDLAKHLDHAMFKPIRDVKAFALAYVDNGTVTWPGDLDMAPEFFYALAHELPAPKTLEQAKSNEFMVSLRELRAITGLTQSEVAEVTGFAQGEVSKLERREDHLLSTLRRYVEALGGKLDLVVRIGDKTVTLRGV